MSNLKMTDWDQATLHAQAVAPGVVRSKEDCRICKCCNLQIDKDDIPMCENIKQLAILGPGFPLYFIFLKYSVFMIFLLSMSYSILAIYWSYSYNFNFCSKDDVRIGEDHQEIHCTSWMVWLSRLEEDIDVNENILRVTSFITQLFFLIYIREQLRKHNAYFHQRQEPKISDYSIMIKNIPKQSHIKKKVPILLERCFSQKYKIECVRPIAYLDHYQTNFDKIEREYKNYLRLIAKVNRTPEDELQIKRTQKYINQLRSEDRNRQDQCAQSIEQDEVICQKVIVILNTERQKQQILKEKLDSTALRQIFGDEADKVQIVSAPQPNQIILSNINLPKSTKIKRIILGWVLFAILLSAVTGVFYLLLTFKSQQIVKSLHLYKSDPNTSASLKSYALALVITSIVLIVLFNKLLLANILHKITDLERHKTASAFELSFSIKYALGLVFTTAILTLLVENIKFHNIYKHDFGVIEEQTIMYFFSAFFVPFIWFVNPWYLWKKVQIFAFRGSLLVTQNQANKIMEFPEYNIGKRYAEIIEMVWFTYFYASLIPIGALLALIGASLFYWVDKYNLLRKSSVKQTISEDFSMKALIMLDLTLVLKPVGELVFDMQIRNEYNIQSLISIIVGAVYVLLPKDSLLDWINGQKFQLNRLSYKQIRSNSLFQMYSQLNPQRISIKNYLEIDGPSQKFKDKLEGDMHDLNSVHALSIQAQITVNRRDQCPEEVS